MPRLKITPAQGFGYGVLCGVGFGLFENLGNTSGGGETWVLLASARISTLLLHALNTGLVGWAIASAFSHRHYLRLAVTFLYAIVMHGLWNGLAVLSFLGSMESLTGTSVPAFYSQLGNLSAIGIVTLGAFNLVFFLGFSTTLRRSVPPPTPLPPIQVDTA
jgi:RsiW-degrading membrane proteinase PrsW (M82 family)